MVNYQEKPMDILNQDKEHEIKYENLNPSHINSPALQGTVGG